MMTMPTFQEIFQRYRWGPIRNCPGRYRLVPSGSVSVEDLVGADAPVYSYRSIHAHDTVLVCELADGGIISYMRKDGLVVHTLNDSDGFARKIRQLEIHG